MEFNDLSILISIVAATLAVLSFMGTVWRLWRDRPRLFIYLGKMNILNRRDNAKFQMLEVRVSNVGFRPTILTRCVFVGDSSAYHPGIDDEPAAMYGVRDQKFPAIINPGETVIFHPIGIDAIERNMTDPKNPKHHFDPYNYMCLVDSFGKLYHVEMDQLRWQIGLLKSWSNPKFWSRLFADLKAQLYLRRARLSGRF